jgi:hypothetical protein
LGNDLNYDTYADHQSSIFNNERLGNIANLKIYHGPR